jgi:hypothetical protein
MSQPRQPTALELVVITRSRLQEVIDEAVDRGRITRGDAADLVADLIARARAQGDGAPVPLDAARRAAGLDGGLPISGFDDLTAAQVAAELDGLSGADLRRVREYEKANANRKTVLAAIERRLA